MKVLHTVHLYDSSVGGSEEVVKQASRSGWSGVVMRSRRLRRPTRAAGVKYINGVRMVGFDLSGNAVWGINGDKKRMSTLFVRAGSGAWT